MKTEMRVTPAIGTSLTNKSISSQSNASVNKLKLDFSNYNKSINIFTLAKAFLAISGMPNKKLQLLCYYAKAWYLALYDHNLIEEQFQAWVQGAVQPALYEKYKVYGFDHIPMVADTQSIPEEFLSFSKEIYSSYGHLSGDELEVVNHSELPWLNARKGYNPWEKCTKEISENDMKTFYREMMI